MRVAEIHAANDAVLLKWWHHPSGERGTFMSVTTRKEHVEILKPLLHKLVSMRQEAPVREFRSRLRPVSPEADASRPAERR